MKLDRDGIATACQMRRDERPWQFIADRLGCSVQDARDAVWAAECLGFQMAAERMARICGAERTAMFLRQCAEALEVRTEN